MMKTPHKHAECIKAWADGAEIEGRQHDGTMWIPNQCPGWYENWQYRIKPEPKLSVTAEILVADFVNWTRVDARNGGPSSGQWAAFDSLKAYILELEQRT